MSLNYEKWSVIIWNFLDHCAINLMLKITQACNILCQVGQAMKSKNTCGEKYGHWSTQLVISLILGVIHTNFR